MDLEQDLPGGSAEALAACEASETKFRAIFDHAADGILLADLEDQKFSTGNRMICEMLGYTPDELKNLWVTDIHPRESLPYVLDQFARQARGEFTLVKEIPVLRKDGSVFYAEVNSYPLQVGGKNYLAGEFRDITERKRLAEAVKERTRQFEAFFDNAIFPLAFLDREFNFIRVNQAYAASGKKAVAEFPGRNHFELYPSDAQPIFAEVVRTGKPFQAFARPFVYPDQPERGITYWDWTLVPILDDLGAVEFLVFSLVEVTEQKKREQEREILLRRIEGVNRLQRSLLVEATQEEKLKCVTDGIVRYFDADFCRIWLIRPGDLCERDCVHAQAPEAEQLCRQRDRCLHLLASSGRYTHTDGLVHRRVPFGCFKIGRIAAGDEHGFLSNDVANDPRVHNHEWARNLGLVSFAGYQLRVPGGRTLGVLGLFARQPISADEDSLLDGLSSTVAMVIQQTAAEAELKNSEAFVRDILTSIDEAFVVIGRDYRILTANRAYCELAGKPLADLVGRPCYEISHHLARPCHECAPDCACKITFEQGEPAVSVHSHTTQGGRRRSVEVKTYAMRDEAGEIKSVIEVINDITEKAVLEGQLRQAQKMEAIGTLAGGIAHDFNNILTAILGYGEIVMDNLPPDSPLREDQGHVLKAGQRARELVKQILTFSRRSEQQLQPLLIQFVVKETLKLLRSSIPASIEMREGIDVGISPVLADPVQIHQVVMNLCTNAYQAMRETGGVLKVFLKSLMISENEAVGRGNLRPGQYVVLEVSDSGCGMERDVRERIFEPYFTTKATGEGTGLGLALVHGIVTGLGGVINVYSEPGLGTTFKVYLPVIAGAICGMAEAKSSAPLGGTESVLLVDDEEAISRLERRVLEGLGYRVSAFADPEQGLQAFRAGPGNFDLLITDMTMPRLNGDELAREVLRIRPEMPVILCTGFSDLINSEKAKALGIREFLQKPLEKGELARAVRRALDHPPAQGD